MSPKWRLTILGGGLALYLTGVGFLWGAVLSQHHKVLEYQREYLRTPVHPVLAGEESLNPLESPYRPTANGALEPKGCHGACVMAERLGFPP